MASSHSIPWTQLNAADKTVCAAISDQLEGRHFRCISSVSMQCSLCTAIYYGTIQCNAHFSPQHIMAQFSAKSSLHSYVSGHNSVQYSLCTAIYHGTIQDKEFRAQRYIRAQYSAIGMYCNNEQRENQALNALQFDNHQKGLDVH